MAPAHPSLWSLACTTIAGGCWLLQAFQPLAERGTFATSTALDAIRLIRSGVITTAPSYAVPALLALPVLGILLLLTAGLAGRRAWRVRAGLAAVGSGIGATLILVLARARLHELSWAGWLIVAGVLACVPALALSRPTQERHS